MFILEPRPEEIESRGESHPVLSAVASLLMTLNLYQLPTSADRRHDGERYLGQAEPIPVETQLV